ncbi:hypothetical protein [Crassaminicella profunda]|uniref:hypothetical protein n=1 Tax=Crassaminicella profunda TaxID=1286698 RepID=UPI001CA6DE6E|nr:hypothetical protein [Crassaminicella profunda]QZY54521.1 hypothetical protein K7H06_15975 [Crassaminicella profunda]
MKGEKIIVGILVAGVLLVAGYNIYNLVENNTASNKIKQKVVHEEKREEAENEYLKIKAIEAIEKHYKVKIDGDKLEFNIEHNTVEKQLERIESMIVELSTRTGERGATIDYLEEEKKRIKFGTIDFFGDVYGGKKLETYAVSFDDETKEILQVTCIKRDVLKKLKPIDFISFEQSKKIAEAFIARNNLEDVEQLKFIGLIEDVTYFEQDEHIFDTFMLFYENMNDVSKKINIKIDRVSGKVNYFSVGKKAVSEYEKNAYHIVEAKEVESKKITREEAVKITENVFEKYFNVKVDTKDVAEDLQYNYSFAIWFARWDGEKYSIVLTKEGKIEGVGYGEEIKQASLTKEEGKKIAAVFIKKHKFADEEDIKCIESNSLGEYKFIYGKDEKTGRNKIIAISLNGNHVNGFDMKLKSVKETEE